MKILISKFFFWFLCLYEQLQFLKTIIFRLEFTLAFRPNTNLNVLKHQKQLSSKTNFNMFLQLNFSSFSLKL